MSKITLAGLVSLTNETSAVTTINNNSTVLQTAFENTLSRDGTSPNQMSANIDMNSNRLLNLPAPLTAGEPLRLADINTFVPSGTISTISPVFSGTVTAGNYQETSTTDHSFTMKARTNVALGYSVPVFRTVKANSPTAMDLWPSGPTPVESAGGNGFTWFDACDADLATNELNPIRCGRISMTSTGAAIGSVNFNGATALPILFVVGSGLGTAVKGSINSNGQYIIGLGTDTPVFSSALSIVNPVTANPAMCVRDSVNHSEWFVTASTGVYTGSATNHNYIIRTNNVDRATFDTAGNLSGLLSLQRVGGVAIQGTNTNDSAAAGYVGENIASSVAVGSAVAMTTATPLNVTSISLTAGDWQVTAQAYMLLAASTSFTNFQYSISSTSATVDLTPGKWTNFNTAAVVLGNVNSTFGTLSFRVSLAATTTIYLVAQGSFTVSTAGAWGSIAARRMR